MTSNSQSKIPRFWEDSPVESRPLVTGPLKYSTSLIHFGVGIIMLLVTVAPAMAIAFFSLPITIVYLLLVAGAYALSYSQQRRRNLLAAEIHEIQEKAKLETHAHDIGSAVHVAGHPVLGRDQAVVLALTDGYLSIFSYDGPTPIDNLPIAEIRLVQTIVYDDERVPHADVIDEAAQALQITFTRDGNQWVCLFKSFHKVRAIDWYHAIQKARM